MTVRTLCAPLPPSLPPPSYDMMESHFAWTARGFQRPLASVRLTDFFGSVSRTVQVRKVRVHRRL